MLTYNLSFQDEGTYQQLMRLAEAAGLRVVNNGLALPSAPPKRSREELLALIRQGGDGQSIPDPLAWQRQQRDNGDLPFGELDQHASQ